ncbi:MAG: DMT family transporter [Acidimicrobiales bacterium]
MKRLFLLTFIRGWSFLFIKVAVQGMTPPTVGAVRLGLGAAVVLAVVRARRWAMPRGWTWWRHFLFVGAFGSALPFTMLAWGEQHISSALRAVLNASTPLFAAVMASILVGDRFRPVQVGGLLLGSVGVAVAAGLGGSDLRESSAWGEAAAVAAGACYGLSFAYARRNLMGQAPLLAAAGQLVTGTLLLVPAAAATSVRGGFDVNARQALAVVLLACSAPASPTSSATASSPTSGRPAPRR